MDCFKKMEIHYSAGAGPAEQGVMSNGFLQKKENPLLRSNGFRQKMEIDYSGVMDFFNKIKIHYSLLLAPQGRAGHRGAPRPGARRGFRFRMFRNIGRLTPGWN